MKLKEKLKEKFKEFSVDFYNSWPERSDPDDEESMLCWALMLLPTIKIMHDDLFGRKIGIGFLFWSINITFNKSIYDY